VTAIGTTGGSALWYLARGSGVVTIVFLTVSVLLGILTSFRWSSENWPRFVVEFVHRNVSLLVLVFLAIHVVTVLADAFAPIRIVDVFVPFVSAYRPIWLGFGALALDLVVALLVTSLLRHRIGYASWRFVHWLAYVCWPVAIVHGLGTGTDTTSRLVFGLTAACVAAVIIAASLRIVRGIVDRPVLRGAGLVTVVVGPILLFAWTLAGPLANGWARRAGTPARLIASGSNNTAYAASGSPTPTTTLPSSNDIPDAGFTSRFAGPIQQGATDSRGLQTLGLVGTLSDRTGTLDVELIGRPLAGGGVAINNGTVTLTGGAGDRWTGTVASLDGNRVYSTVTGPNGARLQLGIEYSELDQQAGRMRGTVTGAPPTATGATRGGDDDGGHR
jgi:hypothetical protein